MTPYSIPRPSFHALKLASALAALAIASPAFSAEVYWNNTSLNWNTSTATWNDSAAGDGATTVWVNGDSAVFSAGTALTAGPYSLTNGGVTVDNITQQEGRVRVSSGTITLADTAAIYDVQTRVSGDYDLRVDSILANSSGGASSITKNGAGVLMLGGANTFSGGFTLNAGSVFVEGQSAAFGTGTLTLAGGNLAKSYGTTAVNFANAVNVTGTTNLAILDQGGTENDMTFSGTLTGTGTLQIGNTAVAGINVAVTSIRFSGDISDFTGVFSLNVLTGTNVGNALRFGASDAALITVDGSQARFALAGSTTNNKPLTLSDGAHGTLKMGELSGTGGYIRAGWSTGGNTTFEVGALNTHSSFGGRIDDNIRSAGGRSLLNKVGAGALLLGGANTYSGGTTVSAGTLLVGNTTGSGTGVGAVTVDAGARLGGTGILAPTGANGVLINGILSPGGTVSAVTGGSFADSVGTLTFNLGGTTGGVTLASGADLRFQLGASGLSLDAAGASDRVALTSASAGDFIFSGNTVNFGGTGELGYFKLFDTSLDATTWSGLTFDETTGVVSVGLSYSNLVSGLTGTFIVGTASNGGELGDIYFSAVSAIPEPGSYAALFGAASAAVIALRRRRLQS